jgi:hypothetical protein
MGSGAAANSPAPESGRPLPGTGTAQAKTDQVPTTNNDLLPVLQKLLMALASKPPAPPSTAAAVTVAVPTSTTAGTTAPPATQPLSTIDKIFGGEALTGSKTMIGVLAYVLVTVLKAAGVLGAATPAGQILMVLSIAFSVLGGVAKIDRMTQFLGNIAASNTPKT